MRGGFFLLIIAVTIGFFACEDPNTMAVSKAFSNNGLQTIYSDTFSVVTSTVQLDTFLSNGSGNIVIGRYNDSEIGKLSASSYFQLTFQNYFAPTYQSYFDSIVLMLPYNKTFTGDTTTAMNIRGFQVTEQMIYRQIPAGVGRVSPFANQNGYFSSTKYDYSPSPIFQKSVKLYPHRDSLTIRLPDSFGLDWFTKAQEGAQLGSGYNSIIFNNPSLFAEPFFRGMYLDVDPSTPGCIAGFTASKAHLRIYYRKSINGLLKSQKFDFTVNTGIQFNHFDYDRSATPLASLSVSKGISSSKTFNRTYVQSGSGLVTRMDFPSLKSFFANRPNVQLNGAFLVMYPEPGTFPKNYLVPSLFQLFYTDDTNVPIGSFVGGSASVIYDNILGLNTTATFNLYNYVFAQLKSSGAEKLNPLLLVPGNGFGGNAQRAYITDRFQGKYRLKLQLYYTYVPT